MAIFYSKYKLNYIGSTESANNKPYWDLYDGFNEGLNRVVINATFSKLAYDGVTYLSTF